MISPVVAFCHPLSSLPTSSPSHSVVPVTKGHLCYARLLLSPNLPHSISNCISHSSSHALLHVTLSPSPPTPYPISLVQKELAFSARGSYFYSNNTLENLYSAPLRLRYLHICAQVKYGSCFLGATTQSIPQYILKTDLSTLCETRCMYMYIRTYMYKYM